MGDMRLRLITIAYMAVFISYIILLLSGDTRKTPETPLLHTPSVVYKKEELPYLKQVEYKTYYDILQEFEKTRINLENQRLAKLKAEQQKRAKEREQKINNLVNRLKEMNVNNAEYFVHLAYEYGNKYNIDPVWLLAIMKTESNFNPRATSNHGARGLMQILPSTGRVMGVSNSSHLYNAETSVAAASKYLDYLRDRFGSIEMAIIAYNQGEGNVSKGTYKTWYLKKVKSNYFHINR